MEKNPQLQVLATNNLILISSEVQLLKSQGVHFFLFLFFNLPITSCDK
jgi:hypothetical protein